MRYRWHPWYGRTVWIHEDLEKHGEGIRRCRIQNSAKARPLVLPAWMFDEERCRVMEVRSAARVDCKALQRVSELLKQRKSQSRRDGVVEDQQLPGSADAEASSRHRRVQLDLFQARGRTGKGFLTEAFFRLKPHYAWSSASATRAANSLYRLRNKSTSIFQTHSKVGQYEARL